jgi:hypothetical protein
MNGVSNPDLVAVLVFGFAIHCITVYALLKLALTGRPVMTRKGEDRGSSTEAR